MSKHDFIVKRDFQIEHLLLIIILYHAAGSVVLNLPFCYVIVSLLFDLDQLLGGLHVTARVTFTIQTIVPQRVRFDPHINRPARPPPPYEASSEAESQNAEEAPQVQEEPRVQIEEDSDETLVESD